jgi:hypothetical protein
MSLSMSSADGRLPVHAAGAEHQPPGVAIGTDGFAAGVEFGQPVG